MPKPENIVKHQFKKGQSGNVNGRPPKTISQINKDLIKMGYKVVTKREIIEASLFIISLPTKLVQSIANGEGDKKDYPFYYPRVAQELLSDKGHEIIEKILDRSFGKAKQSTDITTKGKSLNAPLLNIDPLTNEDDKSTS